MFSEIYQPYMDSTFQQAVGEQISGTPVLGICGLEPPAMTVMDGTPFLSSNRAIGEFIGDILLSLANLEVNTQMNSPLGMLEGIISFNNLYNWPNPQAKQLKASRVCLPFISSFTLDLTEKSKC